MKSFHQIIPIRPRAKGRPRVTANGHAYTPKETKKYEQDFAELYEGPLYETELLSVKLAFTTAGTEVFIEPVKLNTNIDQPKGKLTGDIDNYAKAVLDALNGVAYTDDKQIVCLYLEKA